MSEKQMDPREVEIRKTDMGAMAKHIYGIMMREVQSQIDMLEKLTANNVDPVLATKSIAEIKVLAISQSMQLGMQLAASIAVLPNAPDRAENVRTEVPEEDKQTNAEVARAMMEPR